MKSINVRLKRKSVSKNILMADSVEDYLFEQGKDIENAVRRMTIEPADTEVERVENRKRRSAVDVIVERTSDVVNNHLLEKAVERR